MRSLNRYLIRTACLFLLAAAFAQAAWAQAADVDARPSFPQVMTVDRVILIENIVVLDGERYRLPPMEDGASGAERRDGTRTNRLSLEQLASGMRVQVVTDGSMPSDTHVPVILQMERAP